MQVEYLVHIKCQKMLTFISISINNISDCFFKAFSEIVKERML